MNVIDKVKNKFDLTDTLLWEEADVLVNTAIAMNEAPTTTDGIMYALWIRDSPLCIQAHIDMVSDGGSKKGWSKGHWDVALQKMVYDKEPEDDTVVIAQKKTLGRIRNIVYVEGGGILGADDRAGVMSCILIDSICKKQGTTPPSILLTNKEESGGQGVKKFLKDCTEDALIDTRLFLGLDRKGNGEYVQYIDIVDEVKKYIESFGFVKGYGSYSDSKDVSRAWSIPSVNLSVGYYDAHGKSESLHLDEMMLTVNRVMEIIKDPIGQRYEVPKEKVWGGYKSGYYNGYGDGWDGLTGKDWLDEYDKRNKQVKYKKSPNNPIAKSSSKTDKKHNSARDSRKDRCIKMMKKYALPPASAFYPYLDYLLTNEKIKDGFHIVSSPGLGKELSEWAFIFGRSSVGKNEISDRWRLIFGKAGRLYVDSAAFTGKFYLAVSGLMVPLTAQYCETFEEIVKNRLKGEDNFEKSNVILLPAPVIDPQPEEDSRDTSVEDSFAEMHGYCGFFTDGNCDGSCHGDRGACPYPEFLKYDGGGANRGAFR